jgi:hypothetical protein
MPRLVGDRSRSDPLRWGVYLLASSLTIITDFQPTHYGLAFQKEFAGSAGIVYKCGAIKK